MNCKGRRRSIGVFNTRWHLTNTELLSTRSSDKGLLVHNRVRGKRWWDGVQGTWVDQHDSLHIPPNLRTCITHEHKEDYKLQNATLALNSPGYSYFNFSRVDRTEFTFSSMIGRARYNSVLNPCTPSSWMSFASQETYLWTIINILTLGNRILSIDV